MTFSADLSKEEDTKMLVEKTVTELGRIDILVNNAGVLEMGNIENTSLEQYDRVMNVNVRYVQISVQISIILQSVPRILC